MFYLSPIFQTVSSNYSPFPIPTEILRILGITAIFQIYVLKLHETGRNWVIHEITFISYLVQWKAKIAGFEVKPKPRFNFTSDI